MLFLLFSQDISPQMSEKAKPLPLKEQKAEVVRQNRILLRRIEKDRKAIDDFVKKQLRIRAKSPRLRRRKLRAQIPLLKKYNESLKKERARFEILKNILDIYNIVKKLKAPTTTTIVESNTTLLNNLLNTYNTLKAQYDALLLDRDGLRAQNNAILVEKDNLEREIYPVVRDAIQLYGQMIDKDQNDAAAMGRLRRDAIQALDRFINIYRLNLKVDLTGRIRYQRGAHRVFGSVVPNPLPGQLVAEGPNNQVTTVEDAIKEFDPGFVFGMIPAIP